MGHCACWDLGLYSTSALASLVPWFGGQGAANPGKSRGLDWPRWALRYPGRKLTWGGNCGRLHWAELDVSPFLFCLPCCPTPLHSPGAGPAAWSVSCHPSIICWQVPSSCIALPKSEINAGIVNRSGDGGPPTLPPGRRSLAMWEHSGIPAGPWDAQQDAGAEQMLPSLPHILRVPEVLQASGSGLFTYRKADSVFP